MSRASDNITVLTDGHPDPTDRKKDIIQLFIACGLALLLGIAAYFLAPITKKNSFEIAPKIILYQYLLPAFWLALGWALMHALGVIGVINPSRSPTKKPLHIVILTLVLLYAAVMLPFLIESIRNMILSSQYRQNPSLYPDGFHFAYNIPIFLQSIELTIIDAMHQQAAVFAIPGILYRLTKPEKPENKKGHPADLHMQ